MSLQDKKNEALSQLETIVAKAKNENRAFTQEERSSFDKIEADIKSISEDIARETRANDLRKNVEQVVEQRVLPAIGSKKDDMVEQFRNHVLRGAFMEQRDLAVGSGVLVPTQIDSAIRAVIAALPGVEAAAGAKSLTGFASYPAFLTATADWIAEGSAITPNDPSTASIDLKPFALGAIGKVTDRLANATGEDFVADFVGTFADAIYRKQEEAYWTGSGTNQPLGLAHGAGMDGALPTASVTLTSGSVVIKQLTNAIYAVPAENRAGAVFVATDTFLAAMAGMVASDGKPLNIVTFVNNVPYIMGYRVISTPATAASTTGTCVAVFGNLNQYRIAKFGNGAYFYKKLDQLYAASLSSGHLLSTFRDARIGRKSAFVKILAAA